MQQRLCDGSAARLSKALTATTIIPISLSLALWAFSLSPTRVTSAAAPPVDSACKQGVHDVMGGGSPVALLDLGVQGLQLLLLCGYGAPRGVLLQLQVLHLQSPCCLGMDMEVCSG